MISPPSSIPVRYGISEWYGNRLKEITPRLRSKLALTAQSSLRPVSSSSVPETGPLIDVTCPFQPVITRCAKAGGFCSIQRYERSNTGKIGASIGESVVTCPHRFEEDHTLLRWYAEIVGFDPETTMYAREVPFMRSENTNRPAGKLDWVIAQVVHGVLKWYALEIQAVYFSGTGMESEFYSIGNDPTMNPPFPNAVRRPDWRSSSAKRLMPQLQVKVPTIRRWGSKIAVAVDLPFFEAIGGSSGQPSRDIDDGDVIWMVPRFVPQTRRLKLVRGDWEVLTLEESSRKLLSARTISRSDFEASLRNKMTPLGGE